MEKEIISSLQFSQLFDFNEKEKKELVVFKEWEWIGFTIKKDYVIDGLLFKPAHTEKGIQDSVAIIQVVLLIDNINEDWIAPIYWRISCESRYLMSWKFDYNFEDIDSPTKQSLINSNNTLQPEDLMSYGEYFYDTKNHIFLKNKKKIKAISIIIELYDIHLKTVKKFSWIPFRSEKMIQNKIILIIEILIKWFKYILKNWFGRNLEKKWSYYEHNWFVDRYNKDDLLPTSLNKISLLWFETNTTKQSILTLCCVVIIFFILKTYFFEFNFKRINILFKNNIFLWSFSILLIHIFDNLFPEFIRIIINFLNKNQYKIMNRKISILP